VLPFVNQAYFGPDIRFAEIQPALTMDMGASDNLLSINFSQDGSLPVLATGQMAVPESPITIPFAFPSARIPPLVVMPTLPRKVQVLRNTAKFDPLQAAAAAESVQSGRLDSVTASGQVDAFRYGSVIRPRRLIGVRGAGYSYNGLYWVTQVTHLIERDKYTQSFQLAREGVYSITPVVVP
jgi:hypothetical protein